MWHCLLLCNYKMYLKDKVGCLFFFFAGFNCFDFYIRWVQHVLVFWHLFSLDSTVLISIFAGFNMF